MNERMDKGMNEQGDTVQVNNIAELSSPSKRFCKTNQSKRPIINAN